MSIRTIGARSIATRSAVTFALALTAVGGLATASQSATTVSAQPAMALSAVSGKETGTNAITATTTTNKFYAGKVAVQFQLTTSLTNNCSTTYTAAAANSFIAATSTAIISAKKISIVVPTLTAAAGPGTTQTWLVCAYAGNTAGTSKLLAKAGYTSAGAPALSALTANVQVPTFGGSTINVVGTGFAAGVNSATLGGKALTDINVVDDTLFTATTPANPAGAAALTVNTVGGTDTTLSSAANHYVYVDSIQVSPTTGVGGTVVPLSVQGYGFNNMSFTTSTGANTLSDEAGKAHVYLVTAGAYDASTNAGKKNKPQVNECTTIQVISDTELVCSLDLSKKTGAAPVINANLVAGPTPDGLYQVTLVADGGLGGSAAQQVAAGSAFTVAPF